MTTAPTLPSPESLGLPAAYRQQSTLATRDAVAEDGRPGPSTLLRRDRHAASPAPANAGPGSEPADEADPRSDAVRASVEVDDAGNDAYWTPERIANSAIYQHHVYAWAAHLLRSSRRRPGAERDALATAARRVLDVGCGPGVKLQRLIQPLAEDICGVDQPSAVTIARRTAPGLRFEPVDLDDPDAKPPGVFDIIICADVIEHLADPRPLLGYLRRACHERSFIVLSTPDRDRLRGRGCLASPMVEHVREWNAPEFRGFLADQGFDVLRSRLLPADDSPRLGGWWRETAFRCRAASTSPWRCHTVLCRPRAA